MEELISQLHLHARSVWKYRWQAMAITWLIALSGWITVYSWPNDYQSSSRIYVDTQTILKPLLSGMTSVPNVEQQVSIMSRTLLSRPHLERVMRMVDLDVESTSVRKHEAQLRQLASNIHISGTSAHDIYTITYRHHNARLVRDVVQALLTIFVEGSFEGKKNDSQQALQFIDEQIRSYETRLVAAENAVKEFKIRHTGMLPREGDHSAELARAADALSSARLELAEAEQAGAAIRAQVGTEPVRQGGKRRAARLGNPEIDARIASVAQSLDALRMQYTDRHPDILAARRLIAQLKARKAAQAASPRSDGDPGRYYSPMLQQLKMALTEADARTAAIRVRVGEYRARHARLLERGKALPGIEAQLAQLNRDYDVNKATHEKLIGKREAARLSGDLSATTEMMTFKIIDPPTLPTAAVGPDRPMLYSLVMLAALAGGALAGLLISQARPTFAGSAELRDVTGRPVLGAVRMQWRDADKLRRQRGRRRLAVAFGALLLAFAALLACAYLSH